MDDDAFLRAIRAQPDDDLPRLVYADYLDEHGQADRAEFIRIGCERARRPVHDHRRWRLAERELQLLADHQKEWERPFPGALTVRFDRGFPAAVEIEAHAFLAKCREILDHCPGASIRLRNSWEELDGLCKLPDDVGIRELNLGANGLSDADLQRLLHGARWLRRLTALDLSDNQLTEASGRAIAHAQSLGRLCDLSLAQTAIGPHGVERIASSSRLGNLRSLELGFTSIGDAGVIALAGSQSLQSLAHLDLRGNELGPDGVQALIDRQGWRRLVLRSQDVSFADRQRLADQLGDAVEFRS